MFDVLNGTITGIKDSYKNVGQIGSVKDLVNMLINTLLAVTFALSTIGIAYSFVAFIISAGDKDAVKKAKTSLTWSVIVLLLCFLVLVLKQIFFNLFGVNKQFNPTATQGPPAGW